MLKRRWRTVLQNSSTTWTGDVLLHEHITLSLAIVVFLATNVNILFSIFKLLYSFIALLIVITQ